MTLIFALLLFYLVGCFLNWLILSVMIKMKSKCNDDTDMNILEIMLSKEINATLGDKIAKSWWVTVQLFLNENIS